VCEERVAGTHSAPTLPCLVGWLAGCVTGLIKVVSSKKPPRHKTHAQANSTTSIGVARSREEFSENNDGISIVPPQASSNCVFFIFFYFFILNKFVRKKFKGGTCGFLSFYWWSQGVCF
jgi:hypothetical protein